MDVKSGYKQTEVGVIPDDWDVKPFGDLFDFSGGFSASRAQLSEKGHCYLHYGDIHGAIKTCVDTQADFQDIPKLDIPLKNVSSKSLLKDGDVVFVDASEDDEGTSRHVVVVNKGNLPFVSGLHTIVAKGKTDELTHEYRRYCFQTAAIRRQFQFYAVGTKVSGISKSNIPKLLLPFPTIPEQRAIAEALSDVDALLGGLDRLIAKKRDLKQAAMQQLLTGQTRLPGFSGEWEVKRLREVAEIGAGINKPLSEMGSGALYVTVQDLYDGASIRTHRLSRIKVSLSEVEAKCLAVGDIVFGKSSVKREGIGYPSQFLGCGEPVVFSGFTYRARARQGIADARFLFYALRAEKTRRWLIDNSQASALTNINQLIADAIPVHLPPTVAEQTAIAAVLSDMDAELAALKARRDKTRDLKQAMMQELLTGRTRLV